MTVTLVIITFVSVAVAATTSVVLWRMLREERRRSEARVAALASEIHDREGVELPLRPSREPIAVAMPPRRAAIGVRAEPVRLQPVPPRPIEIGELFTVAEPARSGSRAAAVAAGVLVVCAAAALAVVVGGGSRASTIAPRGAAAGRGADVRPAAASLPVPLELVALGHDRDGDRLTVRGVVRNPPTGAPVAALTAVVFVFTRQGEFLASGRAMVGSMPIAPGGESPFLVVVPDVADVGRYRVSFRNDAGVVPHVDRRDRSAVARIE